uniref:RdRp n=1 Tax=Erysiphe necator associated mitovirus 3 TaxID=2691991 RepID=A0A7U3MF10_9VIRU|nr:RdRp [Erysiphe necator associated mitovirus 3]
MKDITFKVLLSIKKLVTRKEKMLPLDNKLLSTLKMDILSLVKLNMNKISGISGRLRITHNFFQFILKMNRNHGPIFTVKWLKACTVSLQKYLGEDKISSLRVLEPNIPLPRVINGCPAIINKQDRHLIRSGNVGIIRFWHALFSVYRILSIPGKLKLETISGPFNGDLSSLNNITNSALNWKWSKSISRLAENQNLSPRNFILSSKASPSNVMACYGIFTDVANLMISEEGKEVYYNMLKYLDTLSTKWNTKFFLSKFQDAVSIISNDEITEGNLNKKKNMEGGFGQFAIKEEAAGKVRVFALVDSVTQSVLKPLHEALFAVLRSLPNDGTFDQESSVRRCQVKAMASGKAFSFDLSAATDRLPVILTGNIFESLFQIPGLGKSWSDFLVNRDFHFPEKISSKFNLNSEGVPSKLRYEVGQPMGALSSWAGLAITHHWIMQYSSALVFGVSNNWNDQYEVLGDDIVIFDENLANQYLLVMKAIGVEINLSKSIVSKTKPVFEFAKRTSLSDTLVSGITLSQIRSGITLSSRVSHLFSWLNNSYNFSTSVMELFLRNFSKSLNLWQVKVGSLSLLSLFSNSGKIERNSVIDTVVNPKYGVEFNMDDHKFDIPSRQILNSIVPIAAGNSNLELSKADDRREWTEENIPFIADEILKIALFKSRTLTSKYENNIKIFSLMMFTKSSDFSDLFRSQIEGFVNDVIVGEDLNRNDPYEIEDSIESRLVYHAKTRNVSLEEAYSILGNIERLEYLYSIPVKKDPKKVFDSLSNPLVVDLARSAFMKSPNYWDVSTPNNNLGV